MEYRTQYYTGWGQNKSHKVAINASNGHDFQWYLNNNKPPNILENIKMELYEQCGIL